MPHTPRWDHDSWQEHLRALMRYKLKNKHCRVPIGFVTDDGLKLGRWVNLQRHAHQKGKLPQNRIDSLQFLGFCWDAHEADWQHKYELLEQFVQEQGHCQVHRNHAVLGSWVNNQRKMKKDDKLSEERIGKLDALGFVWDATKLRGKKRDTGCPPQAEGEEGTSIPAAPARAPKKRKTETPEAELARLRKLLEKRNETIGQQKKTISELEKDNQSKNERIAELEEDNQNKDDRIAELEAGNVIVEQQQQQQQNQYHHQHPNEERVLPAIPQHHGYGHGLYNAWR